MYWLKACPRCNGDLKEERDNYGVYVACIQCGFLLSSEDEQSLRLSGRVAREPVGPTYKAA